MGKEWDSFVPTVELWKECLRVLKPGGYLLSFAGTRTQHRMAVNIEDAGFEIRDMIAWVYGSGFPKSMDVSKAFDKAAGAERAGTGEMVSGGCRAARGGEELVGSESIESAKWKEITAPATDLAKQWEGWGTALKPALEPITVARKPLIGTVAANVAEYGTGAINIDACRVGNETIIYKNGCGGGKNLVNRMMGSNLQNDQDFRAKEWVQTGRFPANLIHDGSPEVVALFPDSNGSGGSVPNVKITGYGNGAVGSGKSEYLGGERTKVNSGSGSAARFFKQVAYSEDGICQDQNQNQETASVAARCLYQRIRLDGFVQSLAVTKDRPVGLRCANVSVEHSTSETQNELNKNVEIVMQTILNFEQKFWQECEPESTQRITLANGVVVQKQTGTMTITANHSQSGGCAVSATFNITQPNSELGVKGCGSRFVYAAKASKKDRDEGLDGFPERQSSVGDVRPCGDFNERLGKTAGIRRNNHPTVKPTDLMQYLCRLVTPPGGVILDPFMGSGSTGKAAMREGFNFIGIEREAEYVAIAEARIKAAM